MRGGAEVERGCLASEGELLVTDIITEEEVAGASAWGQTTLGPGQAPCRAEDAGRALVSSAAVEMTAVVLP